MPITRGAAKLQAEQANWKGDSSLSSPPATPKRSSKGNDGQNSPSSNLATASSVEPPILVSTNKRKRMPAAKHSVKAVKEERGELPHGLGGIRLGSWAEPRIHSEPAPKRARRGITKRQTVAEEEVKIEGHSPEAVTKTAKPEKVVTLKDEPVKNEARVGAIVLGEGYDANISEKRPKKVNASSTTETATPKKRVKKHPYGLTPGLSPFPDHAGPSPEECEEVNRLLSGLHGSKVAPKTVPQPSDTVTGCGEVPDILDAVLRTLLSASTKSENANKAGKGLREAFGTRGFGPENVANYEAIYAAPLADVIKALEPGGLATVKGRNMKKILDIIYQRNTVRLAALSKEQGMGGSASVVGAAHETPEQKAEEVESLKENMLTMAHCFKLTDEEAMEELIRLPGIGVKTASCVMLFCMQRNSFAVDTHVWRLCKWLGWVPSSATRDQCFCHCEVRIPDHLKYSLHQLFVTHGKKCSRCSAATGPGSKEWENTVCPIEHLVTRTGTRKIASNGQKAATKKASPKNAAAAKSAKGMKNEDSEDSFMEMSG